LIQIIIAYLFLKDRDRDGVINDKEFLKVIEAMYEFKGKNKKEYPPSKCVQDIFRRIDGNGDRRLSREEFIEGCLENKNIMVNILLIKSKHLR
jgi:Ca2+-binding EF-hand superfamily protein